MKKQFNFSILLICLTFSASAQFNSEQDVLSYLANKKFVNSSVNITLEFSASGGNLIAGGSVFSNPDVTVISENTAVITLSDGMDSEKKVSLVVYCDVNAVKDRSNNRIYTLKKKSTGSNDYMKNIRR